MLSPRQALVSVALTGWSIEEPAPWLCPLPEADIIALGASHLDEEDGLTDAFASLAREGLFLRLRYPVFAVPAFYCSYEERFLDELPIGFALGGLDIAALKELWCQTRTDNNERFGRAWTYWGLCLGQGSRGNCSFGVCLGPRCCCFIDEAEKCRWDLPFAGVKRIGWPDTSMLEEHTGKPSDTAIQQLLESFRKN